MADGLVGDVDAAFEQECLHVAGAQGEAIVAPDPLADDVAGKVSIFVSLNVVGVGR